MHSVKITLHYEYSFVNKSISSQVKIPMWLDVILICRLKAWAFIMVEGAGWEGALVETSRIKNRRKVDGSGKEVESFDT